MDLKQEFTAGCSLCSNYQKEEGNKIECIKKFKKGGWKKKIEGWICPDCIKKDDGSGVGSDGEKNP